jgi:hypothetical protein
VGQIELERFEHLPVDEVLVRVDDLDPANFVMELLYEFPVHDSSPKLVRTARLWILWPISTPVISDIRSLMASNYMSADVPDQEKDGVGYAISSLGAKLGKRARRENASSPKRKPPAGCAGGRSLQ